MNCKPGQLAWIKVPERFAVGGVEQLHNRVVRTIALRDDCAVPLWQVEPPQTFNGSAPMVGANGVRVQPGKPFVIDALADDWLVPLKGNYEPSELNGIPIVEQTL